MNSKDVNAWIMYHEVQKLSHMGFKKAQIARHLVINVRTVSKYLNMSEVDYENHLIRLSNRNKVLSPYEDFIKAKLTQYPDTSAAQIHDWLKEHHPDLPGVSPRTVFNFVMFVRQKHNIPVTFTTRQYLPIETLPYGQQAQVDFGQYNMLTTSGKRKKVYFFTTVLSRSRMKYLWFLDRPFTAEDVCKAHEKTFKFFGGIPNTMVYDQDRIMVVDENLGDVVLTDTFKKYTRSRSFTLHFCRKADPESKGKIENVVQFVKKNFLYNRKFIDLQTLNEQALAWLNRTANYLEHNYTKKSPQTEFLIEQKHLNPYTPLTVENKENNFYYVRKTNTIAFKSNFYTVPKGTYKGPNTRVIVRQKDSVVGIYNIKEELIINHNLCAGKGQTITNTHHKRDTSKSIKEMTELFTTSFSQPEEAQKYLRHVRKRYQRYIRDHLQVILSTIKDAEQTSIDKTLAFCMNNQLWNGNDFKDVFEVLMWESELQKNKENPTSLMDSKSNSRAEESPDKSDINEYGKIFKNKNAKS